MTQTVSYINIRGIPHYYQWIKESSPTQRSDKPVMVFLHGWGGSGRYWRQTAEALTNHFDCLLYDLRGFGRSRLLSQGRAVQQLESDSRDAYTLEAYAEDLAALLDALNLSQVYLNAHSMGASIAALFLNYYPERVKQAILTCTGLLEYDEQEFSQFHKFGYYVVKFRPHWLPKIPLMDRAFMARFLHRPVPAAMRREFVEDFVVADFDAALGTMLEAVSEKAATIMPSLFTQLSVPTLVVSGEHDQIISAEMGRQAAALNARVDYALIPGTAHFPMLEDSNTYLARVFEFLQSEDRAKKVPQNSI